MALTIWLGVGYYMMIFLAGLQNIPEELYDLRPCWMAVIAGKSIGMSLSLACVRKSPLWQSSRVWLRCKFLTKSLPSPEASGGLLQSGYTVVYYLWQQAFRLSHAGKASAIAMALLIITYFLNLNIRLLERGTEAD